MTPTNHAALAPRFLPVDTDARTRLLIDAVTGARGHACQGCHAPVSAHEVLMSIGTGFRDAARCVDCLAHETGNPRDVLLGHLAAHFTRRACFAEAWAHATWLEGRAPRGPEASAPLHVSTPLSAATLTRVAGAHWDAGEMGCGELVMALRLRLRELDPGDILELRALDPGAREDLPAWCGLTGNPLVRAEHPVYFIARKEN